MSLLAKNQLRGGAESTGKTKTKMRVEARIPRKIEVL